MNHGKSCKIDEMNKKILIEQETQHNDLLVMNHVVAMVTCLCNYYYCTDCNLRIQCPSLAINSELHQRHTYVIILLIIINNY